MKPIEAETVAQALQQFAGRRTYLHFEFPTGGFLRNLAAEIEEAHLRSDGATYRVALRCKEHGWVMMEGLTHMSLQEGAPLFLGALEDEPAQRLNRCIQLSKEPFTP